jgi:aspartyl-tRNA(Asn)/glutamyl-tRNA(Gln) amidotransferase subunit A
MADDELAFMTLRDLAPLIAARKVSPVEVVEAHLARIEALDGVLRSYIYVDADNARAQARAAEAEIAAGGYRGPLHGVTLAHKDIIDVQGLPTTAASKIMQGYIAKEDATVQARLHAAGAICLGKLNLIEFASGSMGLYGYARNPHNLAANPSGSSSGSGVAGAAGLATIVTGTDTGGSVRGPSCFNGLAGLRPTYGRVSRYGCVPLSWSQDTIGPMGRSVYDIAVMLGVMAGPDTRDKTAAQVDVPDYTGDLSRGLKGLRVGVPDGYFFDDLNPQYGTAMQAAIASFRELGAEVKPVSLPACAYASGASWTIAYSESFVLHEAWFRERAHDYTPAFYHKVAAAGMTSAVERILSQRIRQQVTREFIEALHEVEVLVTPGSRTLASEKGAGDMTSVTRPASLAGLPALSVPIGFADDATPLGMQLIGRAFDEATLFRAGYAYEQAHAWSRRRPGAWPDVIPPAFGSGPPPPPVELPPDTLATPSWVMDMARLLDYGFVTEEDARHMAPMLSPVKAQLRAAQRALGLDVEPPTRPAGRL